MRLALSPEQRQRATFPTLEVVASFAWGVAYAGRAQLEGEAFWVVVLQEVTSASPEEIWFSYTDYEEYTTDVVYLQRRGEGEPPFEALVPAGPRSPRRSGSAAQPLPPPADDAHV